MQLAEDGGIIRNFNKVSRVAMCAVICVKTHMAAYGSCTTGKKVESRSGLHALKLAAMKRAVSSRFKRDLLCCVSVTF